MVIFLIDDDIEDHEIFEEAVSQLGHEHTIITAQDGSEALTYLREKAVVLPDYIFLDLNMPVMDGRKTLHELKKNEVLREIPVCIFTTSNWQTDKQITKEMGADNYLVKPGSIKSLTDSLRSYFR